MQQQKRSRVLEGEKDLNECFFKEDIKMGKEGVKKKFTSAMTEMHGDTLLHRLKVTR